MNAWGNPVTPHTPNIPLNDLWQPCADLAIPCKAISPRTPCQHYALRAHLCLCLPCFVFATCTCILPKPSKPILTLLSLSLPLYVCPHICVFFGEISRPAMAGNHTLLAHLCLLLACFLVRLCPCASPPPCKPICTHLRPCTPARTLHYTDNMCIYVNLIKFILIKMPNFICLR